MQDDAYLWDGSGEPDPEVVQLEQALRPFAAPPLRPLVPRRPWLWPTAIAAAGLLAFALWPLRPAAASPWELDSGRHLALGEWLRTGPQQQVRLAATKVGSLRLDADSALQVVAAPAGRERLVLQRGTLHALIWAPAQTFAVDTPAGTSIDLGCAYTLTVDQHGSGLVSVSTGWVAFQAGRFESFIPAGAACRTRRDLGPGLPYFADASPAFLEALRHWEAEPGAVDDLLAHARVRDALTLWHLILRTPTATARRRVAQRFSALVPQPDPLALERADPAALNRAWTSLGLGSTDWWRAWKHPWAG